MKKKVLIVLGILLIVFIAAYLLSDQKQNEVEVGIEDPTKFGLNKLKEIIIATNFTSDGETTALYLERTLKDSGIKITRLARGLPKGGELEYIDEETILSAINQRR
jgi:recombinational DNA repair protein RecR